MVPFVLIFCAHSGLQHSPYPKVNYCIFFFILYHSCSLKYLLLVNILRRQKTYEYYFNFQCCFQSAHSYAIQTQMTRWCQKLLGSTKRTEKSTMNQPVSGRGNMPCDESIVTSANIHTHRHSPGSNPIPYPLILLPNPLLSPSNLN